MKLYIVNKNKLLTNTTVSYDVLDKTSNYALFPIKYVDKRYKTLNSKHIQPYFMEIDINTYNMDNTEVCNIILCNERTRKIIASIICRSSFIDYVCERYDISF